MMGRPTYAEISISALKHNLNLLRSIAQHNFFCPMVKANAYGHGDVEVARILVAEGVKSLGVALYEEAIHLRASGIKSPEILVFSPLTQTSLKQVAEYNLTPVICAESDITLLKNNSHNIKAAHIKFNTGMTRLGFSPDRVSAVKDSLSSIGISITGVCTHLANGADINKKSSSARSQLKTFSKLLGQFSSSVIAHTLNSDALISLSENKSKMLTEYGARPGIALYGGLMSKAFEFKPVMSIKSKIVHTHNVKSGSAVSYFGLWKAKKKSKIAVVPIGYADGVRRNLSNKMKVLLNNSLAKNAGIICMDYLMLDLTDARFSNIKVDQEVEILGSSPENSALHWAQLLKTNSYEILTGISSRVPRVYK